MLYNRYLKAVHKATDCLNCKHFNKEKKKCEGIGKGCFEYDPKTNTCYDPKTKLPIKFN